MSENRKFKLKYDELREGNPAKQQPDEDAVPNLDSENRLYEKPGNARHLYFAWPDGRQMFLNYAYLVSAELNVAEPTNIITLRFKSHSVALKGYKLEKLFSQIGDQTALIIVQVDPRYANALDETDCTVTEIFVELRG